MIGHHTPAWPVGAAPLWDPVGRRCAERCRFVAGIKTEVEKVEKMLLLFGETLDEWLAVQKNWMYLESIFGAPDIQRQLPGPAKAFQVVDKEFRAIMRAVKERPLALAVCSWHPNAHTTCTAGADLRESPHLSQAGPPLRCPASQWAIVAI